MKPQLATVPLLTHISTCPQPSVLSLEHQRLILKATLMLTDSIMLGLAFLSAYNLRFRLNVTLSPEAVPNTELYPPLAMLLIPVSVLVFALFRLYDRSMLLGGISEYSKMFHACSTGTMIVVVASFMVPQFVVSRIWLIASWLFSFILTVTNRFLCRRIVYALRSRGYLLTPAVIIGTNEEAVTLAEELGHWRSSGLRIVGFVSTKMDIRRRLDAPILGSANQIQQIIAEHGVEDLIVAITALSREELLQLCEDVNSATGVQLRLSSGLYELLTTSVTAKTIGKVPLVTVNKVRLEPEETYIKSVLEYSLSVTALLLLFPLLAALAILVKLDSRGPVIYRRRVLGVSGKPFDAFKFRTMHLNGEDLLKRQPGLEKQLLRDHKLKHDPRITRTGVWLRKYSLDELPQLFNVVMGQMSLVGPRMITLQEADKYGRHRFNLLTVKPGITGLWQVSGRSDLSYDDRVQLDMYYVRNYSVWLDLQILFVQTIPAVLRGRGAY